MKTLILIVIALFLSPTAWADWWSKEVKEPERPSVCYHYFDVGKGVSFVFKGGCEELEHVGIVDIRKNKVIVINGALEKEFSSEFSTPKARIDFTEKRWKGLTPVKYSDIKD